MITPGWKLTTVWGDSLRETVRRGNNSQLGTGVRVNGAVSGAGEVEIAEIEVRRQVCGGCCVDHAAGAVTVVHSRPNLRLVPVMN